ncbi:MAG: DtxR family transcriptional regulator [Anaerolineaceae bacterium]|nr:DtxR family transcriptional regulator [Anaerolineaceae bacterium]
MPDPIVLLLAAALLFALALLIFHPRKGIFIRLRAGRAAAQREKMEDILKFILDRQQEGRFTSNEALIDVLSIHPNELLRVRKTMEAQGLVRVEGGTLALTATGQQLALQIARAHRLWERYLATEARLPLQKIHREAHRMEHRISQSEVNALDAALGYPLFDPHGDPIPNRAGELPAKELGKPLTEWEAGTPGRIIQFEDEPPLAYEQILAEGLKLGQTLRVIEATPERYVLTDGENEYRLAPAVAANVFLVPSPKAAIHGGDVFPLASLDDDQPAEVVNIDESCQGFTRRRFLDLGLTPGTIIYPELNNFFGDPRAYRVRGTLIALRRDQAGMIQVRRLEPE